MPATPDPDDTAELPRWRCTNIACRAEYPDGHQPPGRCPVCGAATERVPVRGGTAETKGA